MDADQPRRLGLEVRFEPLPIQGRLYDEHDRRVDRPFTGWLGLMSAIEAARSAAPSAPEGEEA